VNNIVGAFNGKSFKGLTVSSIRTLGNRCPDDHLECAVLAGVANVNETLVRGTTVFGDSEIAVLGLIWLCCGYHLRAERGQKARVGTRLG
jgi:hypothetical protein